MMYRKLFSSLFIFISIIFCISAQENDEWYWNQPISQIEFTGLKHVKKSELTGITSTFINQNFTDEVYNEILDRLYALDFFEEVNPTVSRENDKKGDSVLLTFEVIERPTIDAILFSGNKKIRNGELREKIKVKASDIFIESKILMDERIIKNHYFSKGYIKANVTHKIENTEKGVVVTFNINEGNSTVIKEIHFTGNTVFSERALKGKITSKEVGLLKDGGYQPSVLEQDKLAIIAYYKEHGYADVNIIDVEIQENENSEKQRNELSITFIIQEGVKYTYGGLKLVGNEVFSKAQLLKQQKMKEGAVYNETKFQEDLATIANVYYENGYMSNDFAPTPYKDTDRHEISYTLAIREKARSHIENIIIKGNTKTKEYVIRREIPIESGEVFSRDKIMNGFRNLMNLQYFSNIIPEPQPGSEENLVDLVWTVEEQSTSMFNFGMTFTGVTDPNQLPISLFLKLQNSNLFGEGKTVSAQTTISNVEQSVDFSYGQNWLANLPLSLSTSLALSHTNSAALINYWTPDFDLKQRYYYMNYQGWGATLSTGVTRRWIPNYAILSLSGGISNSLQNNVYDESLYVPYDKGIASNANRLGLSNSIFASFSVDNRDVSFDPTKGWFASERLAWFGLIPNVEKEFFLKSDTKLEGYLNILNIPVTEKWAFKLTFAAYTGLTMIIPTSSGISDSSKLYIDGMINGRGWIDLYRTKRGLFMLSNRLELRMPIVPGIIGVDGFFDFAAIKDKTSDISSLHIDDFYFSFGPSLRFLMPQLPLKFVFAWRFKTYDGTPKFEQNPFQFVLSFSLINH